MDTAYKKSDDQDSEKTINIPDKDKTSSNI